MDRSVWSVNAHINKLWKASSHVITTRLKSWTRLISPTWRACCGPGLLFFRAVIRKSRRQKEGITFRWVRIDRLWVESDQRCDARVLFSRHSWAWFIQVAVDSVFRTRAWIVSLRTEVFGLSIFSLCLLNPKGLWSSGWEKGLPAWFCLKVLILRPSLSLEADK